MKMTVSRNYIISFGIIGLLGITVLGIAIFRNKKTVPSANSSIASKIQSTQSVIFLRNNKLVQKEFSGDEKELSENANVLFGSQNDLIFFGTDTQGYGSANRHSIEVWSYDTTKNTSKLLFRLTNVNRVQYIPEVNAFLWTTAVEKDHITVSETLKLTSLDGQERLVAESLKIAVLGQPFAYFVDGQIVFPVFSTNETVKIVSWFEGTLSTWSVKLEKGMAPVGVIDGRLVVRTTHCDEYICEPPQKLLRIIDKLRTDELTSVEFSSVGNVFQHENAVFADALPYPLPNQPSGPSRCTMLYAVQAQGTDLRIGRMSFAVPFGMNQLIVGEPVRSCGDVRLWIADTTGQFLQQLSESAVFQPDIGVPAVVIAS